VWGGGGHPVDVGDGERGEGGSENEANDSLQKKVAVRRSAMGVVGRKKAAAVS
jgi:hypothetical protein